MIDASTSLPPEPRSVPGARRFVRDCLQRIGLFAAWDAAELLVSEVVTNAVLHARTDFVVEVRRIGERVRVSVTDLSSAMPRQREYGTDATTGRGMRLIATLATAWGVDRTAQGKTVWFEVNVTGNTGSVEEHWSDEVDLEALIEAFDDVADDDVRALAPMLFTRGRHEQPITRSAA